MHNAHRAVHINCKQHCTHLPPLHLHLCPRLNVWLGLRPQLLRASDDAPLHPTPLWARSQLADSQLVQEFRRECRVVRKGMDGDLVKVGVLRALAGTQWWHQQPPRSLRVLQLAVARQWAMCAPAAKACICPEPSTSLPAPQTLAPPCKPACATLVPPCAR
jgi:hypothetical protein